MPTLWNPDDLAVAQRRLGTLTDAHQARWGRMSCAQMLRHLTWGVQMATGARPVPRLRTRLPLRFAPLRYLILNVLPFPRGAPTAPSLRVGEVGTVAEERAGLEAALAAFVAMDRRAPWSPHPAFGSMDGPAWGAFTWKHVDHHLRQFGA
ncbi:MAG: DUF1569 domain-containing protein [Gemmatimonadaceae bacterium]|nr:DUF1569 domain-containing protein [Gemmatimonadaceae bacterium]